MKRTFFIVCILAVIIGSCKQATKKQAVNKATEKTHKENVVSSNSTVLQETVEKNTNESSEDKELPNIEDVDLTMLIIKESSFLGMIGDNIQRLEIVFLTINKKNDTEYEVTGKSKVKNNICDFKGIMEVQYVIKSDIERGEISTVDGKLTGKYLFAEDTTQSGTGFFKGESEIYWAYNDDNTIGLADFWYTASYYTLLFSGSWTSYLTGKSKISCWTDYKGCFPDGFDRSDGPDLIPDEKYRSSGWGDYIDMWSSDEDTREKAEKEHRENWWNWWK